MVVRSFSGLQEMFSFMKIPLWLQWHRSLGLNDNVWFTHHIFVGQYNRKCGSFLLEHALWPDSKPSKIIFCQTLGDREEYCHLLWKLKINNEIKNKYIIKIIYSMIAVINVSVCESYSVFFLFLNHILYGIYFCTKSLMPIMFNNQADWLS